MKRRPTSQTDLILTVAAVNDPRLKPYHRNVLNTLAVRASYSTGENAIPTYPLLQAALGQKSAKWVGDLLRELRAWGLVERTHKGRGEGNASVFRICLEHPAFPDEYPTFKPKPVKVNRKQALPVYEPDLPQADDELTASEIEVNRKQESSLPQADDELTASAYLQPSNSSIQGLQPKTTTTTTTTDTVSGETAKGRKPPLWLSLLWSLAIKELEPEERSKRQRMLIFRKDRNGESPDTAEIEALVDKEGGDFDAEVMVAIAWAEFCLAEPNPHLNEKTLFPVSVFLPKADNYMEAARRDFQYYVIEKKAWKEKSKEPYPGYNFPGIRLVFENTRPPKNFFTRYIGREQ